MWLSLSFILLSRLEDSARREPVYRSNLQEFVWRWLLLQTQHVYLFKWPAVSQLWSRSRSSVLQRQVYEWRQLPGGLVLLLKGLHRQPLWTTCVRERLPERWALHRTQQMCLCLWFHWPAVRERLQDWTMFYAGEQPDVSGPAKWNCLHQNPLLRHHWSSMGPPL